MNKNVKNKNGSDILLSICLLTYNQPNELQRTLESLLPQITEEIRGKIEIIINDNSDDNETKLLVEKMFSKDYIKYFKNEDEKTVYSNVLNAINRSQGEYVWLFGDDKLEPGAIEHILKIIKNNKCNYIFTNFYIADQGPGKPVVNLKNDEIVENGSIVLEKAANVLGFISSNIMRRECLLNIDKETLYRFKEYVNFYVAMHVLSLPGLSYLCSYPYVCAYAVLAGKMTEKYKRDAFKSFVADTPDILNSFKGKFDKKAVKYLLAKNFGHIWRGVLVGIVNNRGISKDQIKLMFKYYWNFPEFWIALPFFVMPSFMTKFFYKIYAKLKGNNKNPNSLLARVPWF